MLLTEFFFMTYYALNISIMFKNISIYVLNDSTAAYLTHYIRTKVQKHVLKIET